GCDHESTAHSAATTENLVVAHGEMELQIGESTHRLSCGDAIFFVADVAHSYRNVGRGPAVAYLVMNYPESISY
ncbi:MAG: cupin domain-containing protein, partial [Steroidobacter sp.]